MASLGNIKFTPEKITAYTEVKASIGCLNEQVTRHMEEGWQPWGYPMQSGNTIVQVMVEFESNE